MEPNQNTPTAQPSDEANQKSVVSSEGITKAAQPQSGMAKGNPKAPSSKFWKAWRVWWPRGKTAWLLFGELVTLLWAVALWDSYRPKITITPGGTLNSKSPFGTYFIVQNQGSLPIANVTYNSRLITIAASGNSNQPSAVTNYEQNVTIISQMRSLESYSLAIQYPQMQLSRLPMPTNGVADLPTNTIAVKQMMLLFNISYEPKFFGKRTDSLNFFAVPDVDGNWQWLPSAHQDVNEQIIDTNLIPKLPTVPTNAVSPTNAVVITSAQAKTNSPPGTNRLDGNSTPIHTNQSTAHP